MRRFLSILLWALISFCLNASDDVPAKTVSVGIQFYHQNGNQYIALNFENYPKWHTYWKNPGDAGLSLKNIFSIGGKEIKFDELEWPGPKRFIEPGNLWAYGYEGSYTFFYKLSKSTLNNFSGKKINLKSTWLVCKHICVPGQKELEFQISANKIVSSTPDLLDTVSEQILNERFMNLPKSAQIPDYLSIKLSKGKSDKTLVLSYEVKKTTDTSFLTQSNLLYAFPQIPFDVKHESLAILEQSLLGITEISWDGEYIDPPVDFPKDGKFKKPYTLKFLFSDPIQKKLLVIEKTFKNFDLAEINVPAADNSSTNPPINNSSSGNQIKGPNIINVSSTNSFFYYMVLAFIGGFILNIMPCVLPVISLKLFGLVKYKNESHSTILRHNFFYTLGILFTFIILAGSVLFFKSIGNQVGWGFQLQSPNFIAIMVIILFIFSLNLFGLFEFSTPGGKSLGNIQIKDGFSGDFLSGILATVLSTPCSAPFLGTALTFAFSSSNLEIFIIFIAIGLGLASPFIITAIFPQLVSFLPKPGNWMNTVKKFLGLTLILTIIWLLDVYNALVDGSSHLIKLAILLVFIFAGFSLLKKEKWIGAISFLISLSLFINLTMTPIVYSNEEQTALIRDKQAKGLNWEPWSEAKMLEYQQNGQDVFVDFTAKWCFTCKVNEKLVLETEDFKKLSQEKNLRLLIADWTKRDEVIGSYLRKNGLVGVPAYFILKKDGTLINLGETITLVKIKDYLN